MAFELLTSENTLFMLFLCVEKDLRQIWEGMAVRCTGSIELTYWLERRYGARSCMRPDNSQVRHHNTRLFVLKLRARGLHRY